MPVECEIIITALETLSAENLRLAFVKNHLLDESKRQDNSKKMGKNLPVVFAVKESNKHGKPKGKRYSNITIVIKLTTMQEKKKSSSTYAT